MPITCALFSSSSADVVGRGEVLERMCVIAGPAGALEALWQGGARRGGASARALPVVLVPPHPRLHGNMESAVLAELVWHLARRGHPTFRFNYRGVGASQGHNAVPWASPEDPVTDDDIVPLVDDAASVLVHAQATCDAHGVALVGYSVGALVASRLARARDNIEQLILVAPPLACAAVAGPLASVPGATTILVGDDDRCAPLDLIRAAAPTARIDVIARANHVFAAGLSGLAQRTAQLLPGSDDE